MSAAWLGFATDGAGFVGAAIIATAYFLNQRGLLASSDWRFPAINLAGSMLIMLSLVFHPNLPSVVIEVFWSLISLYGLRRSRRNGLEHRSDRP